MSAEGAVLFARYAYPPNELGYCGPDGAADLLGTDVAEIARRARLFDGAWSYLEVIATCAGVDDPLDEAVVRAYWVGNELLDAVPPGVLVERLRERFRGQVGGTWRSADARAVAHHSFQVFEVYPWAGLLPSPTAVTVLDRCRIRTGTVVAVSGESAMVRCRLLRFDAGRLVPGDEAEEVVRWSAGGRSLLPGLASGDVVAVHWDWVCDVLRSGDGEWLSRLEGRCLGGLGLARSG
jgi:hypothetical protein